MHLFTDTKKKKLDKWVICFYILLGITFIIKTLLVLSVPGPVVYGDELLYKKRAMELFYQHKYFSSSYPLGYPLVISVAFFFDHFYVAMKMINVILGALAYIAIWNLCRLFMDTKKVFGTVLIITLLPWQYLVCPQIMSENLFFPLLFWTLYFFVRTLFTEHTSLKYSFFLGLLLASLELTRHIAIVLLPVFALFWVLEINDKNRLRICINKEKLLTGVMVLCGYVLLYGIWIGSRMSIGEPFGYAIGLQISNGLGMEKIKDYATLSSLFIMIAIYILYATLQVLYTFTACMTGIHNSLSGKANRKYTKITVLFVGITIMLLVAASRHSWRSEYNYPQISYILGRYVLYISALWIILFRLWEHKIDFIGDIQKLKIYQIIELGLITVALLILVKNQFLNLGEDFLNNYNTQDTYYLHYLFWVVFLAALAKLYVLLKRPEKYFPVTNLLLLGTLFTGSILSVTQLFTSDTGSRGGFGAVFSTFINEHMDEKYDFVINDTFAVDFSQDIEFWSTPDSHLLYAASGSHELREYQKLGFSIINNKYYEDYDIISILNPDQISDNMLSSPNLQGLVYCEVSEDFEEKTPYTYDFHEKTYGIYHYPISLKQVGILQTYPDRITVGEGFNLQPDGMSAMSIQVNCSDKVYEVLLNGEYYDDMYIGKEGLGSILIPEKYYSHKGSLIIQLQKKGTPPYVSSPIVSNTYTIPVIEGAENAAH